MCTHEELSTAAELLDLPDEGGLVGSILYATGRRLRDCKSPKNMDSRHAYPEFGCVCIVGHRYVDLDVVRGTSPLELRLDLDHVLYPAPFVVLDLPGREMIIQHEY